MAGGRTGPRGQPRAEVGGRASGVNQMKLVHVDEARIVVARTEDGYAAFQDRCTHRGGPPIGALICGTVQCPWHGSQFDVQTGEVVRSCGGKDQDLRIENTHHVRQVAPLSDAVRRRREWSRR